MKTRMSIVILVVAVLTLCFAATQIIADGKCGGKEKETPCTITDLPAAVAATLQAQGGTIGEIDKEEQGANVWYEADITLNGVKWEAKVGPDGTLISMKKADDEEEADEENDAETEVAIADVPAAVAATLQAQAQGGTIDEIVKEDEKGVVSYEADITLNGVMWEAKVGADGTLISMQKADDEKDEGKEEGNKDDEKDETD